MGFRSTTALVALSAGLAAVGCTGEDNASPRAATSNAGYVFPAPPKTRDGPLEAQVATAIGRLLDSAAVGVIDADALARVGASGDARIGWLVSDLLRFYQGSADDGRLVEVFERLSGIDLAADPQLDGGSWGSVTDHLLAWELPAPPGYVRWKAKLFLAVEPRWKPFFDAAPSEIDWRRVSWGGVPIDDRKLGDPNPCPSGCIPALDDPQLTPASAGGWYPDERIVFGIVVGDEAVALPKNLMEVHELVNMSVGGRRLGIPYCTLCGSAQAYLVDAVPAGVEAPILRTSGLLSRSNKVMYDLVTRSVFDTFTGRALSGPLLREDVTLPQVTVVSSTWGEWKQAHPATRIVARDGGIGRSYPDDPLRGRDDDGPIFPVGDVDSRLPVQGRVVGAIAEDGRPVAFPVEAARAALEAGELVRAHGIELAADGGGFRASAEGGSVELPAHEAFWFAWSQFHPSTELWTRP